MIGKGQQGDTELNTLEGLKYVWTSWRIMGMHPFETHKAIYTVYSVIMNFSFSFLGAMSFVINFFFVEDLKTLMGVSSISLSVITSSIKQAIIFYHKKDLLKINEILKELDQRSISCPEEVSILKDIIGYCGKLFRAYNYIFYGSYSCYVLSAYFSHGLVFNGWIPFNWKASELNYWSAFIYQSVSMFVIIIQNISNDVYPSTYISLFKGHLRTLGMRIERIGQKDANKDLNYIELIKCIKDHEKLLKFFLLMKNVISQTIFLQFIVTGFALCTTAVYFLKYASGVLEIFIAVSYSMVLVCEALPCCYLMSGLMSLSEEFVTTIYSCNWIDQDRRFRITILMFMQKCQKKLQIVAGGLFPITLDTYIQVNIIYVGFHLYTFFFYFRYPNFHFQCLLYLKM